MLIFLGIRVPQDDPARAHMQGFQRGVPVVSIADSEPPGLVLDKERRMLLHAPICCLQRDDAGLPAIGRLAIGQLALRTAGALQLLQFDAKGPRQKRCSRARPSEKAGFFPGPFR